MPNRWSFTTRQSVLCGALACLIAIGTWMAWNAARQSIESVASVQHTFAVLLQIDELAGALLDAETGQRGFLLTGEANYLEPYDAGVARALPAADRLDALTADDPALRTRFATLKPLVEAKLGEMAATIERARTESREIAMETVRSGVGKQTMDQIRALLDAARSEEGGSLKRRLVVRDRSLHRALVSAAALGGASFLVFAAVIASLNRTMRQRQAAEREALEAEQRLRVTLESIGDAVIATDVAGRVVYLNPVAQALTGWRAPDAIGAPLDQVFRIVNEHSREMVESPVSKVMREGGVVGLANHTVLIARDGSERPIDDSGAPIVDASGALMGVVLVFRDVTAPRLSEQARDRLLRAEAAQETAESANRAKDEFLAIVSHELRSPLTAAIGWIDLIKGGKLDPTQQAHALDTIERNLRHQTWLVSDLLDVSRIVAGKLTIDRIPVDVSSIVHDVVGDYRTRADAKGVALHLEGSGPLIAMVDHARFEQIVSNLLSNAIRFTPEGGRIDVALAADAKGIELVVRDTGQGIAPSFLPHVFDRFRQADASAVRDHGGLGLGLSIAKHLAEQHGGSITAASEGEGRGATFRVRLPVDAKASAVAPGAHGGNRRPVSSTLSGVDILFVEDHDDTRDAIAHRLGARGAHVTVASSAAEALRLYGASRPTLLLSDLGLPKESGLVLIGRIRAEDAKAGVHTAAIAISGFVSGEDRREALSAGFDDHVAKPIDFGSLLERIDAVLGRRPI